MQTFLPYADFAASARCLDPRRLGKQRVEALQVLRGLTVPGYGWRHHPAVRMWSGFEEALTRYGLEVCAVWTQLGFADTVAASLRAELGREPRTQADLASAGALPPWLGDEAFHRSHRAALLRKDPDHYRDEFDDAPEDPDYVWPPRPAEA